MHQTPGRPLKVGLILPQIEHFMEGQTARWSDLAAMAREAEAIGCDSLWVVDHLLMEGVRQTGQIEGIWECWSLLAALAAITKRVELGTLVTCTTFRNPALLAKMADTTDEISGGRLILGLGAGWHEPEYRAFGYPFDHRIGRFEEALRIIVPLLRTGHVDFAGDYYTARDCELRPRGPRPAGPPILIGALAHATRMLRLTAQYADQWNAWQVFGRSYPDAIPPLRDAVDAACRAADRDPATLTRTAGVLLDFTSQVTHAGNFPAQYARTNTAPILGTPEEMAATLREFAAVGITHLQVRLVPNSLAGIARFGQVLTLLNDGQM